MNVRYFECFIILAEELNFRRAAERCMLTQPALSQQLLQIENAFGARLVSRTNRHVQLTPAGEIFLNKAKDILERMRETKRLVQHTESGKIGSIVIGATIPAIYIILADIINRMKKRIPAVDVIVHAMDTAVQEEEIRKNHIDIGIAHPPFEDKTLAATNIAKIPFDIVMSKENPLAQNKTLNMKDLANETFILFPRKMGPLQYDSIISLCLQARFSPKNIIEVSPAQAIIAFAGSGLGIGFIASKLQQFAHPNVVYRPIEDRKPYFALGVLHRQGKDTNPVIQMFKEIALDVGNHAE